MVGPDMADGIDQLFNAVYNSNLFFYGYGLGLFASVGRAEQWLYIIGIWIFQIIFSHWWLKHFRFGPLEWIWRSLTYWKFQKMKKQ